LRNVKKKIVKDELATDS